MLFRSENINKENSQQMIKKVLNVLSDKLMIMNSSSYGIKLTNSLAALITPSFELLIE